MYSSNAIKNAVILVLDLAYAVENTKNVDTLFKKYDILIYVLNNVIFPCRAYEEFYYAKERGFERYKELFNRPISPLQSLLISEPDTVPLSKVLIVLALNIQEKLTENMEEVPERQKIVDCIGYQLMKRCHNLEQELTNLDKEFAKNGKVEVFTIEE